MSELPTTADPEARASTWSPLRYGVFRAIWLAVLVSNIGLWMQTVGAQWLLVQQPHASILVALVQTADMLPDVIFGVVGGVLADMFDRRRLLIAVQAFMAVAGIALTVLTFAGQMPPALLLTFTFVLGSGSVISLPAYQSLIPDLVPRAELAAASTLGSISVNLARAIGPAIAGVLIARIGVGAVFAINAGTFLAYAIVVAAWHPERRAVDATSRAICLRAPCGGPVRPLLAGDAADAAAHLAVPGAGQRLWALLPLVATQRLQLGASGYGLLLGALGVGAVAGSFLLPRLRAQLSPNRLLVVSSVVYAAVMVAVVLIPNAVVAVVVLLPAGLAWITVLSTMNASLQLFLPEWVRARGLSVYLTVLFGSQAVGAVALGCGRGAEGRGARVPGCRRADGRRRRDHRDLAADRHGGMDRQTVALSEPQLAARRRTRRGSGRREHHLHDRGRTGGRLPEGDGPRAPLEAPHRRHPVGPLPQR